MPAEKVGGHENQLDPAGIHETEQQHRAAERLFWFDQIRTARWLNGITIAAALVALFGLYFVNRSIEHADQGVVDANRAWVAIKGVWHDRTAHYTVGSSLNLVLELQNVGNSPAANLNWKVEQGYLPLPGRFLDVSRTDFNNLDLCTEPAGAAKGPVIFPDKTRSPYAVAEDNGYFPPGYQIGDKDRRTLVTPGMLDGSEVLYVRGCLDYSTMNVVGRTQFCFFVQPYNREGGLQGTSSIACNHGNSAE